MPDNVRIGMAADFGSGLYAARDIGARLADFDYAIHLGDIYYAGTERETKEYFLPLWPRRDGLISRALNANHEMYSGGHGYYRHVLPAFEQKSAYFALQNRHFLILGLDTGYVDDDLDEAQVAWISAQIDAAGERKIILLTHHQPFSQCERGKTLKPHPMVAKLEPWLNARRIFAWYFGHEHRAVLYDAHPSWGLLGRCIGHAGYPYFRYGRFPVIPDNWVHPVNLEASPHIGRGGSQWWRLPESTTGAPTAMLLDDPNPYVALHGADPERYGSQGYLSLHLDGEHCIERLHRASGEIIHEQALS